MSCIAGLYKDQFEFIFALCRPVSKVIIIHPSSFAIIVYKCDLPVGSIATAMTDKVDNVWLEFADAISEIISSGKQRTCIRRLRTISI